MSGDHSIIAPSSAGIWGKPGGCTAFPVMASTYPEDGEREEAAEGTRAHELAASMIDMMRVNGLRGAEVSNGVPSDKEIYEGAKLFADDVLTVVDLYPNAELYVEQQVHAKRIHIESYGTVDCFLFDRAANVLYIWDFKYGHGIVEAFENWQAINYAAGIFDTFGVNGLEDQVTTVHVRIVQPRAFHRDGAIREWIVNGGELRTYFNQLRNNAAQALSNNAELHTGSHCRYCPARHACPAALQAGVELWEAATAPQPIELTPEALGVQLAIEIRAIEQMELLKTGHEAQVKALIRKGVNVPGFVYETGVGREAWTVDVESVAAIGEAVGVATTKHVPLTPKQARDAGVPAEAVAALSERPKTAAKLVEDDGTNARRIFG